MLALALLGTAGCNSTPKKKKEKPKISKEAVRLALEEFGNVFSHRVQQTADRLADKCAPEQTEIHRQLIRWKIFSIPTVKRACLQPLEQVALLRAWALCAQQTYYYSEGAGKDAFGEFQGEALATCETLQEGIKSIGASFMDDDQLARAEETIQEFVKVNPIGSEQTPDPAKTAALFKKLEGSASWVLQIPLSPFHAFEGIDEGARAVREFAEVARQFHGTVDLMADYIRWDLELLLTELAEMKALESGARSAETASNAVASMADTASDAEKTASRFVDVAEDLPASVRKEVVQALDDIDPKLTEVRGTIEQADSALAKADSAIARADSALEKANTLGVTIDKATESFTETGVTWTGVLKTFEDTYHLLQYGDLELEAEYRKRQAEKEAARAKMTPEERAKEEADQPPYFDINDYTEATASAANMAIELQELLVDFNGILSNDTFLEKLSAATGSTLQDTATATDGVVDHLFVRALQTIGALLVAALAYRFVSTRYMPRGGQA